MGELTKRPSDDELTQAFRDLPGAPIDPAAKEHILHSLIDTQRTAPGGTVRLASAGVQSRRWRGFGSVMAAVAGVAVVAVGIIGIERAATRHPYTVSGAGPAPHTSVQGGTSTQTAKQVATEAIVLDHEDSSPWRMATVHSVEDLKVQSVPAFRGVKPATPVGKVVTTLSPVPDLSKEVQYTTDERKRWKANATRLINELFVPGTATYRQEVKNLGGAVTGASGQTISIDGGIRSLNLRWSGFNLLKGTETFKGRGDGWASYAQWQGSSKGYVPASPHNVIDYTVTVKRVDGQWKVEKLAWSFAPGSGP